MTASKKASTVVIKAPKIVAAWNSLCKDHATAQGGIVGAIINLHNVLTLESRLGVTDKKAFIGNLEKGGTVSSFFKASHVPAIPTWMNFRKVHKGFDELPIAKQLSVAMSSYDILGVGIGEQIKASKDAEGNPVSSLDNLTKAISVTRKAKVNKAKESTSTPKKEKASKNPLGDILAYFTALDMSALTEDEKDTVAEIHAVIENSMASA